MLAHSPSETPSGEELRSQLTRVLESPQFRTSRRCSEFLRLVVEAAAEGRASTIKERTLGVHIFNRPADYDTNQDPIVRNTAGQVRKRLAQYYFSPGHEAELRIALPPGAYVPEFTWPQVREPSYPEAPPRVEGPGIPLPPMAGEAKRLRPPGLITLALASGLIVGGAWLYPRWQPTALEQFWKPLISASGPITVCVGQGHAYKLTPEWDRYFGTPDSNRLPAPSSVPISDVSPAFSKHIGLVDAQAVVRISGLFARWNKDIQLRGGRSTTFADIRRRPVVLIGAFNNEWTLRLTGEQRFYFDVNAGQFFVRDRQRPDNHAWRIEPDPANPQVEVDYAIVSRVHNATTEQTIVSAAGIRGGGTYAGAEFLTNPAYLNKAIASLPRGWQQRNMQIVLKTKVYAGTPGPPEVVATHLW